MADIKLTIYLKDCQQAITKAMCEALEEVTGEMEARTKDNTKAKTGKTKGSWEHKVDEVNGVGYVGSNYQNAIWEEFGTGIYAQEGNGRKDVPWTYGTPDGKFYKTKGKKPRRALQNAFNSMQYKIEKYFRERFGDIKRLKF